MLVRVRHRKATGERAKKADETDEANDKPGRERLLKNKFGITLSENNQKD
jgi:hypothetical protein